MSSQAAPGQARIRSLDGLRALSILLVVYGHARSTAGFPEALRWLEKLGDVADLGVRVFFVISGYLITSLLVAERRKTGSIALGSFYARRAFRIFPAFYVYLGVMGALGLAGVVRLPGLDLLLAAVYVVNYQPHRAWVVGHAWSLAVEEQFYLIWPAVLRASGERRGLRIALAAVALGPVLRGAMALLFPSQDHRNMIGEVFPTVADSLAAGCALALLGPRLSASERYLRWLRSPVLGAALLLGLGLSVAFGGRHAWVNWLALETVACVCVALVIDRYVRYPDGPVGRLLNWRPLAYVGTLSYSLYLWQQIFLGPPGEPHDPRFWRHFPQNFAFAAGAALLSYSIIEKPFFRLRDRVLRGAAPAPHAGPALHAGPAPGAVSVPFQPTEPAAAPARGAQPSKPGASIAAK